MENFFTACTNLEDGKETYRTLLKKYHPDIFGPDGEAITVELIKQYEQFVKTFYRKTASEFFDNSDINEPEDLTPFTDVLAKVMDLNCRVEIIGFWIYCFDSFEVKATLADLGFWFSSKHKAWVYSGGKKIRRRSNQTLDEIREEKGSHTVRTRKEQKAIPA